MHDINVYNYDGKSIKTYLLARGYLCVNNEMVPNCVTIK